MAHWKTALENCPVKSARYPYADAHPSEQPNIDSIIGDILELQVDKSCEKDGKYDILLTLVRFDLRNLSEEELEARLRFLGADPDSYWD